MAKGAIEERADYEVTKIIDNIIDPNTNPTGKRKLTLTLEFIPDAERTKIGLKVQASSKLMPTEAASTMLCITSGANGEMVVAEMVPQIPGQMDFSGGEQAPPKILKLVQQ